MALLILLLVSRSTIHNSLEFRTGSPTRACKAPMAVVTLGTQLKDFLVPPVRRESARSRSLQHGEVGDLLSVPSLTRLPKPSAKEGAQAFNKVPASKRSSSNFPTIHQGKYFPGVVSIRGSVTDVTITINKYLCQTPPRSPATDVPSDTGSDSRCAT